MNRILLVGALLLGAITSQAQIILHPYAHYGTPPLQSGYGGLGRAVAVVAHDAYINVKGHETIGANPRYNWFIGEYPATDTYEWSTEGGFLEIRPEGSPFIGEQHPLWLYGSLYHDAIRIQAQISGAAVTVVGLPGAYGPETTILVPAYVPCSGRFVVPLANLPGDAIRWSPVLVHNAIIPLLGY